jgi:DNA-directed RNA polymerase specialized sigma24 family protein
MDRQRRSHGLPTRSLPEGLVGRETSPLAALVETEGLQALRAALERLPAGYRAAYLFWAQEELSHPQIAQVLLISEVAARGRVFKARQFLVKELKEYLEPPR